MKTLVELGTSPAPWSIDLWSVCCDDVDEKGHVIRTVCHGIHNPKDKRLIKNAPKMYMECYKMIDWYKGLKSQSFPESFQKIIEEMEQTLKDVEGIRND